jgi:MFS family permease
MFYGVLGLVFLLEWSFSPFIANANDMLVQRHGFTYRQAGVLMFIPMSVSCLVTPLWALFDRRFPRKRRTFLLVSLSLGLCFALQLGIKPAGTLALPLQLLALLALGVGLSGTYTIVDGSVPLIVKEQYLGTAFGLVRTLEAIAMGVSPVLTAFLVSLRDTRAEGYSLCLAECLTVAALSVLLELALICSNRREGRLMDGETP